MQEHEVLLFREDGHLSDAGFAALLAGSLNELGRLEVAEHLEFCDVCMLRYTECLTDDSLLQPEKPLAQEVLPRVRRKKLRISFGRYATVAAAACMAVVLWGVGSNLLPRVMENQGGFSGLGDGASTTQQQMANDNKDNNAGVLPAAGNTEKEDEMTDVEAPSPGITDRLGNVLGNTTDYLGSFFGGLGGSREQNLPKQTGPTQPERQGNTPASRQEKEQLFDQGKPVGSGADAGNSAAE